MTAHRSMYPDSTCERTPTLLDLPRPRHSTCKRKQDAVRVGRFSPTAVYRGNSTASAPLSRCRQARQDSAPVCSVLSSVYL
ncbi:hypothetical protein HBI70_173610 [Parastagonospora nodorum]|nr:hypothetical protein HBI10_093800 [Parastagonospora nodorum]KAH4273837.1 hypothetical protein HBI03_008220 [Parastagonospora nodorum]KAH4403942.1 hypothetical protein HBH99_084250 [Parastagonospora nodorum]KAH5028676.1 hypothetical protein HBI75_130100 [Parastagonospora nodorum]KAH5086717.1 hypothetical protein HBH95_010310 [Parastagonospora nodorum]